ncbi:MAG: hypothetical protein KF788_01265 [Piscinibacter sp.]|nr:hypothetical protein [Piscinibacter sp.]
MSPVTVFLALALAALSPGPAASGTDLHAYWDGRCRDCHGDAGPFARNHLQVVEGRLAGRHHASGLATFLRQHYLSDDLVEPVMQMLQAQAGTDPLFKPKCGGCHGSAADFARKSLTLRGGVLVGRASGRPVREFLKAHGGLAPEQIAPLTSTLERVHREVGSP